MEEYLGGLIKLHIPGALESQRHKEDFAHVHEKPKRTLSPLADLDVLIKWQVKASAELAAVHVDDVHQHEHSLLAKGRLTHI